MKLVLKFIFNIFMIAMMLIGFVMAADSVWGWAVMAIPIVFWMMRFLVVINKNRWLRIVFWLAIASVQWRVAVVALMAFLFFNLAKLIIKQIDFSPGEASNNDLFDAIVEDVYKEGTHLSGGDIIKDP